MLGGDHFAPKYMVGNVPAGDPAVGQLGAFVYISDPGDGTGIVAALALAAVTPGDVWIRPGTYDLGAGGVVTPLSIPAGTIVRGAGPITIIRGRTTGNQGVFLVNEGSTLRDMAIVVASSDATSAGSVAVVRVIGSCDVANITVTFATNAAGALREGIRFEASLTPLAVANIVHTVVTATTTTGGASPTSCYSIMLNAFVTGSDLRAFGGDVGMFSDGSGIVTMSTTLFLNHLVSCVWWQSVLGGGAMRINQALWQIGNAAVNPTIANIEQGGGHTLQSIVIQGNGTDGCRGLVFDGGGMSNVAVTDIDCSGCSDGIIFGGTNPVDDCGLSDASVDVSSIAGLARGVAFLHASSTRCHVTGSSIIALSGATATAVVLIGSRHAVEGNDITQNSTVLTGAALDVSSSASSVVGNVVVSNDAYGIRLRSAALRTVCSANDVECTAAAPAGGCIVLDDGAARSTVGNNVCTQTGVGNVVGAIRVNSVSCTVGDNSVQVSVTAPVTSGIALGATSANCTCVGNVCIGSAGAPVADVGAGNNVSNNVGA